MAVSWGGAAGGAASGALAGASLGPWGALAGGLIGGIGGLFSPTDPYSQMPDPYQINPYTEGYYNSLQADQNYFDNQLKSYLGQAQGSAQNQQNLLTQIMQYDPEAQYDPQAGMRQFMGNSAQLQGLAQQASGGPTDEYVKNLQNQAMAQVNANFAPELRGSSAYMGAAAEGMAAPAFQAALQQQQLQSGLASQLLGQNQSLSYQNAAQQYDAARALDQMRLAQMAQGLSGYQNLGNQQMQGATMFGNMLSNNAQMRGAVAAPTFYEPSLVSNPGYMSPTDWLGLGMGAFGSTMESLPQGATFQDWLQMNPFKKN
jgi:hypothetical protein